MCITEQLYRNTYDSRPQLRVRESAVCEISMWEAHALGHRQRAKQRATQTRNRLAMFEDASTVVDFCSGALGAACADISLFPLDTVHARLMVMAGARQSGVLQEGLAPCSLRALGHCTKA